MKKVLLLLPVFFVSGETAVLAKLGDFVPRFANLGLNLSAELVYISENDKTERNLSVSEKEEKQVKFRESLNFGTLGFVYHPDLFVFGIGSTVSLQQARDEFNGRVSSDKSALEEYSFEGEFLRKKRYHGKVFHTRSHPFFSAQSGIVDNVQAVVSRTRLEMFYDALPWRANFYYHKNSIEKEDFKTEDRDYISSISYRIRDFSEKIDNFSMTVGGSKGEDGGGGVTDHIYASNSLRYNEKIKFTTTASHNTGDSNLQQRATTTFRERIGVEFPWNFDLISNYSLNKSTREMKLEEEVVNSDKEAENIQVSLRQRLFDSVTTTATTTHNRNASEQGNFKHNTYSLGTSYNKKLRGGLVGFDISSEINDIDRKGSILVEEEVYSNIKVNQSFELDNDDVDLGTLFVEAEIPNANNVLVWVALSQCKEVVCLDASEDWSIVDSQVKPIEIMIEEGFKKLGIFTGNLNTDPDIDSYNFRIRYSTTEDDYVLQTRAADFDFRLILLEGRIGGGLSHSITEQEIVEGDSALLKVGESVTDDVVDFFYGSGPFNFTGNYQILQAENKERQWNLDGYYAKDISFLPKVASNISAHYGQGGNTTKYESGGSSNSSEKEYSFDVSSFFIAPFPLFPVNISNRFGYEKQKGHIPEFKRNSLGVVTEISQTEEDQDKYYTEFNLVLKTHIPKTKVELRGNGSFLYQNDSLGEERLSMHYRVSTGYRWMFGATTLSFNAVYKWAWDDVKENDIHQIDTDDGFTISAKLVRIIL